MKNLKNFWSRRLNNVPKWAIITMLVVALIGFADAAFLTVEHYKGEIPPCSIDGCEQVLTSDFSTIFGIPVALYGALYYLLISILLFVRLESGSENALRFAIFGTIVGFLMSIWFTYLQIFVLDSYCQYCLASAVTSTLLFVIGWWSVWKYSTSSSAKNAGQNICIENDQI